MKAHETPSKEVLASDEAWDERVLGTDVDFAEVVSDSVDGSCDMDDALGLQLISIRLPKQLIELYKALATIEGMGYQPLMREVLKRWAENEARLYTIKFADEQRKMATSDDKGPEVESVCQEPRRKRQSRKAA